MVGGFIFLMCVVRGAVGGIGSYCCSLHFAALQTDSAL